MARTQAPDFTPKHGGGIAPKPAPQRRGTPTPVLPPATYPNVVPERLKELRDKGFAQPGGVGNGRVFDEVHNRQVNDSRRRNK